MNGIERNESSPAAPDSQEMDREHRARLLIKIQIIPDGAKIFDAFVRNLSSLGLCARTESIPKPGEKILIRKEGFGEVQATVRWANAREFGVKFAERIDVEQFNFGNLNQDGHFVQKIDNGHVWTGFDHKVSTKRPGLKSR
ncbi:PilZ domain-containing protein [Parasphingorhabdus sp.]|uniref:PilZ domain-containing protein n=1 Tax=Parasphingorhabdus sp. TaxID=2709688 RepID=UPI0032679511